MAEVELKKSNDGLTSKELLEKAPFRDMNEVLNTLKFVESLGLGLGLGLLVSPHAQRYSCL